MEYLLVTKKYLCVFKVHDSQCIADSFTFTSLIHIYFPFLNFNAFSSTNTKRLFNLWKCKYISYSKSLLKKEDPVYSRKLPDKKWQMHYHIFDVYPHSTKISFLADWWGGFFLITRIKIVQ